MRTLRTVLVGSVILAWLALGVLPALAQEGSPTTAGPGAVISTEVCGGRSGGASTFSVPGVSSRRGWVAECVDTMSDPRVDGTYVNTDNSDCYPGVLGGTCVDWGTHVLEGPEGGWDCTWSGD